MRHQIFISYRREGGEYFGKILRDELTRRGYRVFYDVESMGAGAFNNQIYRIIDECDDFILVLPPHALDRCFNEGDWVAEEIRYAIKKEKNIIPVMMKNFSWPETMPAGMDSLPYYEGETFSSSVNGEYIRASVNILCKRLLQSRPNLIKRFLLPAAAAVLTGVLALVLVLALRQNSDATSDPAAVPGVSSPDLPGTAGTPAEPAATDPSTAADPGSYNTEAYLHALFSQYVNRKLENEIFFFYEDYDRDGLYEAFGATGKESALSYEGAACYDDVVIYFMDSSGKISEAGRFSGGYNGCVPYAENGETLLDTGSDLYLVWEEYSGGVFSSSHLYGVRDGAVFSPRYSGVLMNLHFETDHYEALMDYPKEGHARDRFWLMYDAGKQEFFIIARTFKDDADRTLKSLNTASGLLVQNGSRINIDYVELLDGREIERLGTFGAGVDLEVGAGTSIGDFEEQLIGHRVGETFTIDVLVPEGYDIQELAGKTVTFKITVNGIYK